MLISQNNKPIITYKLSLKEAKCLTELLGEFLQRDDVNITDMQQATMLLIKLNSSVSRTNRALGLETSKDDSNEVEGVSEGV